jgi:hypothetical protein
MPNKQVDTDRPDEQLTILEDEIPRSHQLQSFVAQYGVDEKQLSSFDHIKHHAKKQYDSLTFLYCLNVFLDKIPLLRCLKEYNIKKDLFGDIIAGITVAIMHIPQGRKKHIL